MQPDDPAPRFVPPDALAQRLFDATLGALDLVSVYLGDRLGYYRALAEQGPATSVELAQRTGTAERYAREWLEQQAVTGILAVANPDAEPTARCFSLPGTATTPCWWTRTARRRWRRWSGASSAASSRCPSS